MEGLDDKESFIKVSVLSSCAKSAVTEAPRPDVSTVSALGSTGGLTEFRCSVDPNRRISLIGIKLGYSLVLHAQDVPEGPCNVLSPSEDWWRGPGPWRR